jgi:hypothetical protein
VDGSVTGQSRSPCRPIFSHLLVHSPPSPADGFWVVLHCPHVLVMTGGDPERWLGNAHKPLSCQFSALSRAAEVLKAWSVYTLICTCSSLPLRLSSDGPRLLAWSTNLLAACSDRPGPPTDVPLNARPPGEGCESQEEQSRIIRRTAVFTGSHQPMPIPDPPYSASGSL